MPEKMSKDEEEALQLVWGNLQKFGNSNKKRFYLVEDLTLSCDVCKTSEGKKTIREMTEKVVREMAKEEAKANALNLKATRKIKEPSPDFQKKIFETYARFTSVYLGGTTKLQVKPDKSSPFKKLPTLEIKGEF